MSARVFILPLWRRLTGRFPHADARSVWREAGLAVALLAFMLQMMAPIWAADALARDPLLAVPICSHDDGAGGAPAAPVHDHDISCAACMVCGLAHQTLPTASFVLPQPLVQDLRRPLLRSATSARGPPRFQPKARDPPASV